MDEKVKFTCFNCNAKLEAHISFKGKCPSCKAKNTIPSSENTMEDSIIMFFKDIEEHEDEQEFE